MNCPHCNKEINPGSLLGSIKSEKKARASRENGKKGGDNRKKGANLDKKVIHTCNV